jgi:phage major head subunit gpT-like protein
MGNAAALHPDDLVFGLLPKGFSTLCYDGQYFFDADHKDGDSPVQSNVTAKTLTLTSYGAARAAIMSYKDDKGNSLNIIPNLLVVPPQLEGVALKILKAETINNETNIYKDSAELLVVPQLSENPTQWFLMCTTKSVKPIIYQQRKKAELVSKDKTDDDNVFFQKQFIYGVDCRDNAGYGLWQLAYGSTGTDANP